MLGEDLCLEASVSQPAVDLQRLRRDGIARNDTVA
jgi:hypothetical protein